MSEIKFNEPLKYKEMCEMLEDEFKPSGKSRNLQLKRWQKNYEIIKDKTLYTVVRELTDEEKERQQSFTDFQLLINKCVKDCDINRIDKNGGVYAIVYDEDEYNNYVYIGQTNNFRRRLNHHRTSNSKAYQLLLKGGIFEIVKIESDKESRLILERDLIEYYSNNKDFICINDDYNCNRSSVNRDRKPKYKKVKFNYDEWKYIKNILNKENIYYESI